LSGRDCAIPSRVSLPSHARHIASRACRLRRTVRRYRATARCLAIGAGKNLGGVPSCSGWQLWEGRHAGGVTFAHHTARWSPRACHERLPRNFGRRALRSATIGFDDSKRPQHRSPFLHALVSLRGAVNCREIHRLPPFSPAPARRNISTTPSAPRGESPAAAGSPRPLRWSERVPATTQTVFFETRAIGARSPGSAHEHFRLPATARQVSGRFPPRAQQAPQWRTTKSKWANGPLGQIANRPLANGPMDGIKTLRGALSPHFSKAHSAKHCLTHVVRGGAKGSVITVHSSFELRQGSRPPASQSRY